MVAIEVKDTRVTIPSHWTVEDMEALKRILNALGYDFGQSEAFGLFKVVENE